MGFDLDRFESPVDPAFICKLCGKVLEEPLTTPCGHVFCALCVIQWLSKANSCPVQCQKMSTSELNHVLPLKNLILKLDIKCDHHDRGCNRVMKLQHLSDHTEICDFSPVRCEGCDALLSLKDVASHVRETCEHRPVEMCEDGCGLMLSLKQKSDHRCLQALKTHNGLLQGKVLRLERELKRRCLRFSQKERSLLSKLSALHCELHMTAVRFQKKITEYKSRIDALSSSCVPVNEGEETMTLLVTLHRESGSLGFNIIGGQSCEEQEDDYIDGIYVSKIVENGPAEKSGLHVHDRIIEVNGRNLSQVTHDQAVEAFQTAKEPIEVQILRRTAHKTLTTHGVDSSTQTNITLKYLKHIEAMTKLPSSSLPLHMAVLDSFLIPTDCHMTREDSPFPADFIDDLQKDSRGFEYEEVALRRKTTQDKFGLVLCYKTEDEKTVVFVSEIDPEGVAARDGRIQEGDQIIKINGVDIQSHEEAVKLLTKMDSKNVTLLVARHGNQGDCWWEENRNHFLDDLHMDMSVHQVHRAMELTARMLQENRHEEEGTTDTATTLSSNLHEKDSGVGRTDDSTRNDESSEQDLLGDDLPSAYDTLPGNHKKLNYSQDTLGSNDIHLSNDSFLSVDNGDDGNFLDIPGMASERFQELLELKCVANESSPCGYLEHDASLSGERVSLDCDDLDVQMLNKELLNIELECLRILQGHRRQTGEGQQSSNDSGSKHFTEQTCVEKVHQDFTSKQVDKESSSAYNTGESCWSIPPNVERPPDYQSMVTEHKGKDSFTTCPKHPLSPIRETSPTKGHSPSKDLEVTNAGKTKQSGKNHPEKTCSPYQHTYIPAHAQHYQSYMHLIQQKSAVEYAQSQISLASLCQNPETPDSRPKMEWKVKIRSDGTRYITKRPTKDQLLKERALRIREERCSMTTDDDAASELKLGRYWNKEERKQHIARAKEQRQRWDLIKQGRIESKDKARAMDDKKAPDIIQLSHKKMMRRRNKRILDNWMTIQELLTHGTRSTDGTRLYNSFLSVTTV